MFEYFGSKDISQLDSALINANRAMAVWDQANDLANKAETLNLVGSLNQIKGMASADHKLLQVRVLKPFLKPSLLRFALKKPFLLRFALKEDVFTEICTKRSRFY